MNHHARDDIITRQEHAEVIQIVAAERNEALARCRRLEAENARLREALSAIADGDIPPMAQTVGYVPQVRLFARAALGDQTEEAEGGG